MAFTDFLKATVLLCAGAATILAAITVIALTRGRPDELELLLFSVVWWTISCLLGLRLGHSRQLSSAMRKLLGAAQATKMLEQPRPIRTFLNRVWSVFIVTLIAIGVGIFFPQVSSAASGFGIIWALAWRTQEHAVLAIEARDGVRFYIAKTPLFSPIKLLRTISFTRS